jgi:hypothetical protein
MLVRSRTRHDEEDRHDLLTTDVGSRPCGHTFVDEHALVVGVRTTATLAVDFLSSPPAADEPARSPRPFVHDQD